MQHVGKLAVLTLGLGLVALIGATATRPTKDIPDQILKRKACHECDMHSV